MLYTIIYIDIYTLMYNIYACIYIYIYICINIHVNLIDELSLANFGDAESLVMRKHARAFGAP